jgi:hypothetical protein
VFLVIYGMIECKVLGLRGGNDVEIMRSCGDVVSTLAIGASTVN